MIEVGYLCFSEFCVLEGLNISVGREKAIKTLQQIAFGFCFMSRLISASFFLLFFHLRAAAARFSDSHTFEASLFEASVCSPC